MTSICLVNRGPAVFQLRVWNITVAILVFSQSKTHWNSVPLGVFLPVSALFRAHKTRKLSWCQHCRDAGGSGNCQENFLCCQWRQHQHYDDWRVLARACQLERYHDSYLWQWPVALSTLMSTYLWSDDKAISSGMFSKPWRVFIHVDTPRITKTVSPPSCFVRCRTKITM